MYCLGKYYNEALISIECNFSTYPIKELVRIGYKKLFVREVEDSYSGKTTRSFGFRTTVKTKPVLVGMIKDMVRDYVKKEYAHDYQKRQLEQIKEENKNR